MKNTLFRKHGKITFARLKVYPLFNIMVDYEPLTKCINVSFRAQRVAWDLIIVNTEGCQHLWLCFPQAWE